jgi:N-acetylmuramoyl-L-alanine amidase
MDSFRPDSALTSRISPSPNFNERRGGTSVHQRQPDMLILHYTGLKSSDSDAWQRDPGGSALAWLCNPVAEVSCHYLVDEDGAIIQLVPETMRAWHAGSSSWKGEADLNSASIGIEIANLGHDGGLPFFPDDQIKAVINLCNDIVIRWSIPPARVLGHSDIAPGRKSDPGERFPWNRLFEAGVGHWTAAAALDTPGFALAPGDRGKPVSALRRQLADYGYGLPAGDSYDSETEQVVLAFQRHFRPQKCDGIADASTRATLHALLRRLAMNC